MARSRCAASRGVGGAAPRTASRPTSPSCSPGSPPCRRRPSSRSTTKRSSGCTPGARALPCMCTATTVGPRRDPQLPSTAPTSSARASPTSCSPGLGPGPTSSCARCWAHTPAGSPPCMPVPAVARRWAGDGAALVAGIVFAVHPVHVEAVANVVGRNELMAAAFTLLAVYAALERGSVLWSAAALTAGLLSKENAAVAPALVAAAWLLGVRPVPPRRRLAAFVVTWVVLAAAYTGVRWFVLHGFGGAGHAAPLVLRLGAGTHRLTALAARAGGAPLLALPPARPGAPS